jgi:O-antigen ligase
MSLVGALAGKASFVVSPAMQLKGRLRHALEPRDLVVIGVVLAAAFPLAMVVTSGNPLAVALTVLPVLLVVILPLKHSSLFLVVLAMAFTFIRGDGEASALTLSPADLALVVFCVAVLGTLNRRAPADPVDSSGLKTAWAYAWVFTLMGALSLLSVFLFDRDRHPDLLYGSYAVMKIIAVMVFFLAVAHYLQHHGREGEEYLLRTWSGVSIVVVSVAAAAGLLNVFGLSTGFTSWMFYSYRLQGTLSNPNAFAAYVILSLSVVLAYAASRNRPRAPLLVSTVFMFAILLTGSRAAFPSLIAGGLVVCATSGTVRAFLKRLLPVLLLMLWLMFSLASRVPGLAALARATEGAEQGGEADSRFDVWAIAFDLWLHNPLTGAGIGQFRVAATLSEGYRVRIIPHNTYLSYLSEVGTVGFLIALSLPILVGYRLFRLHRAGDLVASCLLIGLVAFGIQGATLNLENLRPFWVALALMFAYTVRRQHVAREGVPPERAQLEVDR